MWHWTPPYTVERIANNPKDSRVTSVLIQADRPKNAGFRQGVAIVIVQGRLLLFFISAVPKRRWTHEIWTNDTQIIERVAPLVPRRGYHHHWKDAFHKMMKVLRRKVRSLTCPDQCLVRAKVAGRPCSHGKSHTDEMCDLGNQSVKHRGSRCGGLVYLY